jgi:hypothetical protein
VPGELAAQPAPVMRRTVLALAGPRRRCRSHRTATSVLVLIVLGYLGAACSSTPRSPGVAGSGSASPTTASSITGQTSDNQSGFMAKLLAYTDCMRQHGIADFPSPTPSPGGQGGGFSVSARSGSDLDPNNPRYQAANRVCQTRLPFGGRPPPRTAKQLAEEVKFAACIRQHGFPGFPDPNNQGVFVLNNFDLSSNRFQSASQTCRTISNFTGPMPVNATNSGPAAPAPH